MLVPPSPLPWLPRCCRHCRRRHCRCHCYGCHQLRRHQHRSCCHCYRFLVDCCLPLCCLCFGHRCLPLRLLLLAANAITTVIAAANRCPLLLPPQPRDVQNITFKVVFEHLCCRFLVLSALVLPLLSPLLPAPAAACLSASSSSLQCAPLALRAACPR